jgi:D-arabinose 5-phosphate isomerase GutQ
MALDYPVQNSEVYLMIPSSSAPLPPSPPSPATPCELEMLPPAEDLMSMSSTLPGKDSASSFATRLEAAVHVLATEATALSCLTRLYETDPVARGGFNMAVEAITRYEDADKGKLVITGIGKSGHIAKKLVATMNSLKIHATYLHPTEALHGDLGKVGKHDTILFITFSGKTPELIQLLPHLDPTLPIIIMTAHTNPSTCVITNIRPDIILLPSPIHKSETESFGVSAPTTSTTIALALGDALAVAISQELHLDVSAVFSKNHPGGAIGAAIKNMKKISDLAIPIVDIPDVGMRATGAHVLMAAYKAESGWVRQGSDMIMSPSCIKKLQPDDMDEPASEIQGLMVSSKDWIRIPIDSNMTVQQAQDMVKLQRKYYCEDSILVLMDDDEVCSVLEIKQVM